MWPIIVSVVYVGLASGYFFRWGPVVQHIPSLWLGPQDLKYTYFAASQAAHGQFGAIYSPKFDFVDFPGIVVALAPLGALGNSFHTTLLEVTKTASIPVPFSVRFAIPFLNPQEFHHAGGPVYVSHPQWVEAVYPYVLLLSCLALFAFDALAERLQVSNPRRAVLSGVVAVLLWNVTVLWGHPEDAVAAGLAAYALIYALDGRFEPAGWLFGASVAFQPLVLLALPVLLVMAGRRRGPGLAVRSVLPAAVLLAVPLIASFRVTLRELVNQPSFPNLNHATPWTALAPSLGGHGSSLAVAAGPIRLVAIILAIGLGIWVARQQWRQHPERLVYVCALALALRSYTESVMVAYYPAAALAVGVVVAARCSRWRFEMAVALTVAATVLAQWKVGWLPWWTIQMAALTALLVVAAQPKPLVLATPRVDSRPVRTRTSASPPVRSQPARPRTKGKAPPSPTAKRSGRR